jgi:hypothetical protein
MTSRPVAASSLDDPVQSYYDSLEGLHLKVRQNTPFTYLAYKSMIPAKEDDFIGLAYKISYYITFKFFIHLGMHLVSPLCMAIPFVPFVCDVVWLGVQSMRHREDSDSARPSPVTSFFILTTGILWMYFLDQCPEY